MSDTMCAQTTKTSRCQRCGSEFDWLCDGTKIHLGKQYFESDSLLCLERQLNAANAKIKQLEDNRTKAAANSLANMLAYEEAIAKIEKLEREVELLRLYGNKDCTAMADEALRKETKP